MAFLYQKAAKNYQAAFERLGHIPTMLHLEINKIIESVQHLSCRTPIALKQTNKAVGAIKKMREKKP